MKRMKDSRIFSIQLSDHDTLFAPHRREKRRWRWLINTLVLSPAIALFLIPSFRLTRMVQEKSPFELADSLRPGDLVVLPVDDRIDQPTFAGRLMSETESDPGLYFAAVPSAGSNLVIGMTIRREEKNILQKLKEPSLEHPRLSHVSRKIAVATPEEPVLFKPSAEELAVYSRTDGDAKLSCWKEPVQRILENPVIGIRPRGFSPRVASVNAAGPGEVVYITKSMPRTLVIYHGGGLFSRYTNLADFRLRKGDRVRAGQVIATMAGGTLKNPTAIEWQAIHYGNVINHESLMALSSRLCGTK